MSLLCWFPLCDNNNFENKGLYNISLSSSGNPVYTTGGKVGGGVTSSMKQHHHVNIYIQVHLYMKN